MSLGVLSIGISSLGCDAEHLMLAQTIEVRSLGLASIAPGSFPVFSPDGESVIYLQAASSVSFPVTSRNLQTGAERSLFSVPIGALLWTLNSSSSALLLSIPTGADTGRHIVEYTLAGGTIRSFDVPIGSQDYFAAVSPDGSLLAFLRIANGSQATQLMVRDATNGSSTPRSLWSFHNSEVALTVRWLDNQRILISTRAQNTPENVIQDVLSGGRSSALGFGLWATADPRGQRVVSLGTDTADLDLWLGQVNGNSRIRLTNARSDKLAINWSVDGQAIVYETIKGQPPVSSLEVLALPPLK